jgi:hypothetical protein
MPKPDKDMRRISDLFAEARSIANRRDWPSIGRALDQAETALLRWNRLTGKRAELSTARRLKSASPSPTKDEPVKEGARTC